MNKFHAKKSIQIAAISALLFSPFSYGQKDRFRADVKYYESQGLERLQNERVTVSDRVESSVRQLRNGELLRQTVSLLNIGGVLGQAINLQGTMNFFQGINALVSKPAAHYGLNFTETSEPSQHATSCAVVQKDIANSFFQRINSLPEVKKDVARAGVRKVEIVVNSIPSEQVKKVSSNGTVELKRLGRHENHASHILEEFKRGGAIRYDNISRALPEVTSDGVLKLTVHAVEGQSCVAARDQDIFSAIFLALFREGSEDAKIEQIRASGDRWVNNSDKDCKLAKDLLSSGELIYFSNFSLSGLDCKRKRNQAGRTQYHTLQGMVVLSPMSSKKASGSLFDSEDQCLSKKAEMEKTMSQSEQDSDSKKVAVQTFAKMMKNLTVKLSCRLEDNKYRLTAEAYDPKIRTHQDELLERYGSSSSSSLGSSSSAQSL